MRCVVTRKNGIVRFAGADWTVYLIGQDTPASAGIRCYADNHYADRLKMPLWGDLGSRLANPVAYAHQSQVWSECGKVFTAATRLLAHDLWSDHVAECAECQEADARERAIANAEC